MATIKYWKIRYEYINNGKLRSNYCVQEAPSPELASKNATQQLTERHGPTVRIRSCVSY